MGATIIKDGSGSGNTTKVNQANRLLTSSVTTVAGNDAAMQGVSFNHNTGLMTFTDGGEYAGIYLRNDGSNDYIITALAVGIGVLSGTVSDVAEITIIRNPTAGSIITNAVALPVNVNRNFASPKTFNGLAYLGGQSDTFTDGTDALIFISNGSTRLFADTNLIVPQGTSIGVNIKLNATGGGRAYIALVGHEDVD